MNTTKTEVSYEGKVIGEVYLSSHGVWVGEPNFNTFSASFLTKEKAEAELVKFYRESILGE